MRSLEIISKRTKIFGIIQRRVSEPMLNTKGILISAILKLSTLSNGMDIQLEINLTKILKQVQDDLLM
jgi:hypothetical protein